MTFHALVQKLHEAPMPPMPAGGGMGPPGGGLGGLGGGGLPPMPAGGGMGPPGGGLGGLGGMGPPGMGGPGGEQPQKPAPTKITKAGDVWGMLRHAAKDMERFKELDVYYGARKHAAPNEKRGHKSLAV